MLKSSVKKTILSAIIFGMSSTGLQAGSFLTASKPSCEEVDLVVKGRIKYKDTMKSGDLGFHHCIHPRLKSKDFPQSNPNNPQCVQVDMEPEVVSINPPLPHEENPILPLFQRPNPYYISDGTACEVKYAQYYFLR